MLPKVHKPGIPGRPIISGCNSPTANLSGFIDHYLKPIVKGISSYIQDTNHFLRILKEYDGLIPPNPLLVTFDGKSLYTNIPTHLGIEYTMKAINEFYQHNLPLRTQYLKQILNFILYRTIFNLMEIFTYNLRQQLWGHPLPGK